jgi:hypothetical protein
MHFVVAALFLLLFAAPATAQTRACEMVTS